MKINRLKVCWEKKNKQTKNKNKTQNNNKKTTTKRKTTTKNITLSSLSAGCKSRINYVSLILQCTSDRPVAKMSK